MDCSAQIPMPTRTEPHPSAPFDVVVCGSLNLDLQTRLTTLPRPGETVSASTLARWPGGKGLNQAIAAARLGARTAMLGAIGEDADGAILRAALIAEGVDVTRVLSRRATPSGLAQVFVADDGENSIVVHAGANGTLAPDDVHRHTPPARVYLAQGEVPPTSVQVFFERAAATGGLRILNAAPVVPGIELLRRAADLLVLNVTELATLAGCEPEGLQGTSLIDRARSLIATPTQTVIVTQGDRGVSVITASAAEHRAARRVQIVDTTGAGDCFCGALAAALAHGKELMQALQWAQAAASISVGRNGAAPSMPTMAELTAVLELDG